MSSCSVFYFIHLLTQHYYDSIILKHPFPHHTLTINAMNLYCFLFQKHVDNMMMELLPKMYITWQVRFLLKIELCILQTLKYTLYALRFESIFFHESPNINYKVMWASSYITFFQTGFKLSTLLWNQ